MAKDWPAYKKWSYTAGGMEYLKEKMGKVKVTVHKNKDNNINPAINSGYSFDRRDNVTMAFGDFLTEMSATKTGATMRDRSKSMKDKLVEDIVFPKFYHHLSELSGVQILMGQYFIDRTHYTKTDHFVCMVEGTALIRLVPHIYRHELYSG